ncbi:MAG: hypothetical protein AAF182_00895 [Pseudomonadota bacterium]
MSYSFFLALKFSLGVFVVLVLSLTASHNAKAETFYWQDPGSKLSLTVPDTWSMSHNQKPDDVITMIAPSADAFPVCRMRVRQDRRFVIYPHRYANEIQHLHYSQNFWNDYAAEFPSGAVQHYADDAGLGRGRGSFAEIVFAPDAAPLRARKAIAFASLYRDKAYILECSSNLEDYDRWLPAFMSVVKSVQFREEIAQIPGGHFRPLYGAGAIEIMNRRDYDSYFGYGRIPRS